MIATLECADCWRFSIFTKAVQVTALQSPALNLFRTPYVLTNCINSKTQQTEDLMMSGTRKAILIIVGILGAVVLVVFIGVVLIWAAFRKSEPSIRDNSVLTLRVAGSLPDYSPDDPFKKYFGGPDQSLTGLVMQFKKAKVDKRIKAILLDVNLSGVGWGKAEEIRDAITDFRSSGKPVYAYIEFGLNKEYYIATACDKIIVPPPGELFINGLAADPLGSSAHVLAHLAVAPAHVSRRARASDRTRAAAPGAPSR